MVLLVYCMEKAPHLEMSKEKVGHYYVWASMIEQKKHINMVQFLWVKKKIQTN